jgi:hypothetical protein
VRLAGVHLLRRGEGDDRAQQDERRPRGLRAGGLQRGEDAGDVLPALDDLHVPAVGLVPLRGVLGQGDRRVVLDRDLVVVVDDGEVAQLLVPGQGGRLGGDALLDVAVGGDDVDLVVERALARRGVRVEQPPLAPRGHGHADGGGQPLAQRAGGDLDTRGVAVLGVAGGPRPPGAQRLQVRQLQAVAREEQLDVERQAGVARGEHEPVAAHPVGVGRVVPHHALEERVGQGGEAHGGAGVAVADLLHRVGGQHPRGVDRAAVQIGPVGRRRRLREAGDVGIGHGHDGSSFSWGSRGCGFAVRAQPIHSIMDVGGPRLIPPRMVTRRLPGQRRAHASGYHRRVVEVAPRPTTDSGSRFPQVSATVVPVVPGRLTRVRATVAAYAGLTKTRIIEQLLVVTVPAMFLAQRGIPSLWLVAATLVGGAGAAASAHALNCVVDADIDKVMERTSRRPLAKGQVPPRHALVFGLVLGALSAVWLGLTANWLAAALSVAAIAFYVLVYTLLLKRRTAQNIVWGGAAGCMPVVIGWAAVTGTVQWPALVMFAIIFFWTPPHFWALAMRYRDDYAAPGCRCCRSWPRPSRSRGASSPTPG